MSHSKFNKNKIAILIAISTAMSAMNAHSAFELIPSNGSSTLNAPSNLEYKNTAKDSIDAIHSEDASASKKPLTLIPSNYLSQTKFNKESVEARYPRLTFLGDSPEFLDKGFSSGKNIKLENASPLFLKPGWTFVKETLSNPVVSWTKGDYWLDAMNELATQSDSYFLIDWTGKKVTAKAYPTSTVYTLTAGKDLSSELIRWAKLSGWHLMWDLDYDFRIESDTHFKGTFDEVILKMVKAYQANGALLNVMPRISKANNTVKIAEFKEHK